MNIKQLLEKFEKLQLTEMAMYENPRKDFQEFYQYVMDNPNARKTYFVVNGKYRLPHDTIIHDDKRHNLTVQDYYDFFSCIDNVINSNESNKPKYDGKAIKYHVQGNQHFGCVIEYYETPETLPIISTLFMDHPNTIDNWVNQ